MGWIHAGTGGGPTPAWVSCQGARFRRVEWREWEGVDTGAAPTRNQAVASAVVALAADPRCAHDWRDGDPGARDAAIRTVMAALPAAVRFALLSPERRSALFEEGNRRENAPSDAQARGFLVAHPWTEGMEGATTEPDATPLGEALPELERGVSESRGPWILRGHEGGPLEIEYERSGNGGCVVLAIWRPRPTGGDWGPCWAPMDGEVPDADEDWCAMARVARRTGIAPIIDESDPSEWRIAEVEDGVRVRDTRTGVIYQNAGATWPGLTQTVRRGRRSNGYRATVRLHPAAVLI